MIYSNIRPSALSVDHAVRSGVPDWLTLLGREAGELIDRLTWLAARALHAPAAVTFVAGDDEGSAGAELRAVAPVAVPLHSRNWGGVLGRLYVIGQRPTRWTQWDLHALRELATLFVAEVENRVRHIQSDQNGLPGGHGPEAEPAGAQERRPTNRMEPEAETPASSSTEENGPGTILLVEDDPAVLNLVRRVLERAGYHVLAASTAEEGLRIAEQHSGPLALLLTDVLLPGMNGPALARRLSSVRPDAKTIFMSGYVADEFVDESVMESAVAFIPKPFDLRVLVDEVKRALDLR